LDQQHDRAPKGKPTLSTRKPIPDAIQHGVLDRSRRRCALCVHFNNDYGQKHGQIAHIDRDPSIVDEDDLVYLCLQHHDDYDSKRQQTKDLTEREVKTARDRLYEYIQQGGNLSTGPQHPTEEASVLRITFGEAEPYFKTKLRTFYSLERTFNLKHENTDQSRAATACKVYVTEIEPKEPNANAAAQRWLRSGGWRSHFCAAGDLRRSYGSEENTMRRQLYDYLRTQACAQTVR
jgi:hypothetical protein